MNMSKSVRLLSSLILLMVIILILLSGCSRSDSQKTADKQPGASMTPGESATKEDDGVYQAVIEKAEIPGVVDDRLSFGCVKNGTVYYIFGDYDETSNLYKDYVRAVDEKTGTPAGEDFSITDGTEAVRISGLATCGDDGYICTSYSWTETETEYWLYKCSLDGNILFKKNLGELPQVSGNTSFYGGMLSDGTNIYLASDEKLYVLNDRLEFKKIISDAGPVNMCIGSDGLLYFMVGYDGTISAYNPDTGKVTDEVTVIPSGSGIYSGGEGELLVSTSSSLKSFNINTKETVKLFDFLDININNSTGFRSIYRDADGDIHLLFYEFKEDENSEFAGAVTSTIRTATVKRYDADSVPKTEEIRFACFYANSDVKDAVNEYNMAHPGLKVKIKCYSDDYSDYYDMMEAYDRDLLNGVHYDIITFSHSDITKYTEKGLLEDLMPYIEKDSSFDLNDYYENILLANKEGDKLYSIVSGTMIIDMLGNAEAFGDKERITFDDLAKARAESPKSAFMHYVTNSMGAMLFLLNRDYRVYLGGQEGVYDFSAPEFKKLCEFAATFPPQSGDELIPAYGFEDLCNGEEVLAFEHYYSPEAWLTTRCRYDDRIKSYTGLSLEENCYYLDPTTKYSISALSTHKEEAWDVIKKLLNAKNAFGVTEFRASKEVTKSDLDYYYRICGLGCYVSMGGTKIEIYMNESDYDIIEGMMEHATLGHSLDDTVYGIVREEMPAYFAGEKSLDETIKIMQKRVDLYVEENR